MNGSLHRIFIALGKYHAVILLMRAYEMIAEKHVSEAQLDKLTRSPFHAAKCIEGSDTMFLDMLDTCFHANIIYYLADYCVNQIILLAVYVLYVQRRRNQMKLDPKVATPIHGGAFALSVLKKSALLAFSRGMGCLSSAIGGALGSWVWPGWGTLCGINFGDSLSYRLGEDAVPPRE
jgi:hypothetical protein